MVCLETDLLVSFLRQDPEAIGFVRREQAAGKSVTLASISLCELYAGARESKDPRRSEEGIDFVVRGAEVIPIDARVAKEFGRLKRQLSGEGRTVSDFDLLIGTAALLRGEEVATRDRAFHQIPGLRVRKW